MIQRRKTRITRLSVATTGALALLCAGAVSAAASDREAEAARAFAQIKASAPLTTDQEIIDYVACVANTVVLSLEPPHSELNWEMAIVDEDVINAFVMPGGKIVIYEGILKAAQNQHQLAAVIGHEIAHVTAEHTKGNMMQGRGAQVGIQVAAVLLGGGNSGATYTAYEALNQGATFGLLLPYKRNQETEADVIGLEFMAKAGFDPRAAVPLWQNMASQSKRDVPEFMSTHPSSDNRIDSLISQWSKTLPLYNAALQSGRNPNCVVPPKLQQEIAREKAKQEKDRK